MPDSKKKALKSIIRKTALEQNPTGAIHGELSDQTDHLENISETLQKPLEVKLGGEQGQKVTNAGEFVANFLASIKGDKGDFPVYKKDYLTDDELDAIKKELTPVKGEDYYTKEESQDFLRTATPVKDVHYRDGIDGKDGEDGYTPVKGIDYIDGAPGEQGPKGDKGDPGINPDPKEVIKELITLKGNDRLDISNLRNSEQIVGLLGQMRKGKIDFSDQRWHGGGDVVAAGTGITIVTGANGIKTISSAGTGITIGTTTITSGTDTRILYDNAGVVGEYTITGSGTVVAMKTSPIFVTPTLGVALATSINGLIISTTTGTLTITNGKTLSVAKSLTLDGTDSTTMTFPSTSATIARTDATQTFTGTQTFSQVITTANAITASGNAATVPVTSKNNIVTNNSAATLTITLTTTSAVNMQDCIVQIKDFSGVAQTVTWVNTENSTVSVPTTSNGSTTLPLTVGFKFNSATSLWRCVASA